MMSVKVLLEVLVFSAWLQGLAFGLTQSDKVFWLLLSNDYDRFW